jgi:CubicO group peptidase (beta-lactamase class C family)
MPSPRSLSLRSLAVGAFALLFACGACDAAPPAEQEPEPEPEPELTTRAAEPLPHDLDHRVVTYVEQYGRHWPTFRFHGAVLVARGDQIAVDRAFGQADLVSGVTNEPGTVFRIGTLSAQLTAVATMRLVEAGVLSLQDPVSRHLPGWPGGDATTLEQLLSHRSGIPSYTDDIAFEPWKKGPRTLQATLELFRGDPLEFEPGTDTAPSNSNYVLLGAVLEAATGLPYEQVVAQQVLAPLKLEHTYYALSSAAQAVGMTYHEDDFLEVVHGVHPTAFGPAGGWLSTTGDLLRLYRALAHEQLLSAGSVAQMHGQQGEGLGYGWAPTDVAGRSGVSWPGLIDGFNSAVLHLPEDDTTIIVLSNCEVVPSGRLVEDIATLIYEDESPRREEAVAVPVPIEEQLPAVGRYVPTRATEEALLAADADADLLREAFVRRAGDHLVFDVPGHGRKRMYPLGKGRYFFKDGAQTRAEVITRADRSTLLVLETAGGELRLVGVAEEVAGR